MARASRRRRWIVILAVLVVLSVAAGGALGALLKSGLPDVRSLEDYTPLQMTHVVAADGSEIGSFAEQRRILLDSADIPRVFREALIAAEDANFAKHSGLDFAGILRAARNNLLALRAAQGASTITQQLARNLFLRPDKTLRRKLQEAVLAIDIERSYTKEEILRFYCNQVYMGHGRYGLEAASRFFFGKPARDLDLAHAALLAGIIQRPEGLSPLKFPARALSRRNYVLGRMVEERYIGPAEAEAARRIPIETRAHLDPVALAPYFIEDVRRLLQAKYGEEAIYRSGMEIRTTLDARLQEIANRAVDRGLRQLDKRQGWRGVLSRVPAGVSPDDWKPPAWAEGVREGDVTDGVVVSVSGATARVRVGDAVGSLGKDELAWTRRAIPGALLRAGDVIRVRVAKITASGNAALELEQEPLAEAALVAIHPQSGEVRALVGGFDYERSEFDRATQALRQTGSAFKPFVFAAALAAGRSLSDRILDEPTVFLDPTTWEPYQPNNYGNHYYGLLTLREAIEKSANIATVKLLVETGFPRVIEMARRLGISSDLRPYPSLALGAFEISLLELTGAYGALANQGIRVDPHLVREVVAADGTILERVEPAAHEAVSPQIAYLMTKALEGVVTDGTGAAASSLGRTLAGKTGTTDDFTDAWFIGYAPDLVVGVWVGFDVKKSLGSRETGALAALPIWQAFMEEAYEGRPAEDFPVPAGIVLQSVDRRTGLKASPAAGCERTLTEAFAAGTEPTTYCSAAEHARCLLPYPFAAYSLDDQGALAVPAQDLDDLIASEPAVRLAGETLSAMTPEGSVSLPVRRIESASLAPPLPSAVQARTPVGGWRGTDGRRARVIVLDR